MSRYVAGELAEFLGEQGLLEQEIPLGFTFSFPCRQDGLDVARLDHWTKVTIIK